MPGSFVSLEYDPLLKIVNIHSLITLLFKLFSRRNKFLNIIMYIMIAILIVFTLSLDIKLSIRQQHKQRISNKQSKLKSMFYATFTSASTNNVKRFESHVRDLYKKTMTDQSFQINVAEVGFKVSHTQPYFATSLDGIVSCKSEIWGLEIKCPFSKYNFPMDDAIKDRNLFLKHTSEGEFSRD